MFATPDKVSAFYQKVEHTGNSFAKNLQKVLKENPVLLEPNMTKIVNLVASGTHIYVGPSSTVLMLTGKNCLLQTVTVPDVLAESESFIFRKNDPAGLRKINQVTIESISFITYVKEKYRKSVQSE